MGWARTSRERAGVGALSSVCCHSYRRPSISQHNWLPRPRISRSGTPNPPDTCPMKIVIADICPRTPTLNTKRLFTQHVNWTELNWPDPVTRAFIGKRRDYTTCWLAAAKLWRFTCSSKIFQKIQQSTVTSFLVDKSHIALLIMRLIILIIQRVWFWKFLKKILRR